MVEFYCSKDGQLLCSLCMWDHSEHKEKVKCCREKDIMAMISKLEKELENLHNYSIDNILQA
jgi:hypothetical protein